MEMDRIAQVYDQMSHELGKVIQGQKGTIRYLFIALVLQGHVLLESVPGLGKSLLARLVTQLFGGSCRRVQFTPDLMPSDILGTTVYHAETGSFEVSRGPVFTNVLLADEINRASAKTQSALLEAMAERQVSIGNETLSLEPPFLCIATQNPIEMEGTYPLPEAQQDRFLMKLVLNYPEAEEEEGILQSYLEGFDHRQSPEQYIEPICTARDILDMGALCKKVRVDEKIRRYIVSLVRESRNHQRLSYGSSPRGSVALLLASQAAATLDGRDYVTPDDVKELVIPILQHRIILSPDAEISGQSPVDFLQDIIGKVEVPRS